MEHLLVGLIVSVAAAYSVWYLAPANQRQRLVAALAKRCALSRAGAWAPRLQRAAARPTGACAGCGARGKCPVGQSLSKSK